MRTINKRIRFLRKYIASREFEHFIKLFGVIKTKRN